MPLSERIPAWMYEVFAHEMCHVVVVRELRQNPCHKEDDGKIEVRTLDVQAPY